MKTGNIWMLATFNRLPHDNHRAANGDFGHEHLFASLFGNEPLDGKAADLVLR